MKKKLYQVTLNWHGELHKFYTRASRPDLAARNSVAKLAKKLNQTNYQTRQWFNHGDKVLVREIKDD